MSKNAEKLIEGAKKIAEQFISGAVSPYEVSYCIWLHCQLNPDQGNHQLDPFV